MSTGQKEIIVAKIRKALANPTPEPFRDGAEPKDWYQPIGDDLAIAFAEKFIHLQGQFAWCLNFKELKSQLIQLLERKDWHRIYCPDPTMRKLLSLDWYDDLASCQASITGCEALVSRTGTIVLSAAQAEGRTSSVYAPVHICIAFIKQLVPDIGDALKLIQEKYQGQIPSFISFASGPSRTADIEKTLVTGVHGPREVFCFLVEE
jgi:L-lactate dehydrogenase complex protein LldG